MAQEMAGFPRLRRIMFGDVPNVNSIGLMTAENPNAEPLSPAENSDRMKGLESDLRGMGYGFVKIKGQYGVKENSLLIPNISRQELVGLGFKYVQESVIYGEKKFKEDFAYFEFQFIFGETTTQTRNVSMADKNIQDRDDFFSQVKSRKFIIPFYDDAFEGLKPNPAYGSRNVTQEI